MATTTLDWSRCPAVESILGKRSGAWVFRDTRTPVSVVFDNLEVGASIGEIMEGSICRMNRWQRQQSCGENTLYVTTKVATM
jgi:hypothetical protein